MPRTPSGSEKNRKPGDRGPLERKKKKGPEQSGPRGGPGGPKGSAPDRHGGSGAGRQQGGSGSSRER